MHYFLCRYSETFRPRILLASTTLLKILVKETSKSSDHFQSLGGFLLSILFERIILNARFSGADKVPMTELYTAFWDIPIPRCIPLVFKKLLSLGCWSYLLFCQEILKLIPVLCLPVK